MFKNKKADTGVDYGLAFLVAIVVLIFVFLGSSFLSVSTKKAVEEKLGENEDLYRFNSYLIGYLTHPIDYQGQKIDVADFLSYSIVAGKDDLFFETSANEYFDETYYNRGLYVRVDTSSDYASSYNLYPLEPVTLTKYRTKLPLAYNGEYDYVTVVLQTLK